MSLSPKKYPRRVKNDLLGLKDSFSTVKSDFLGIGRAFQGRETIS